MELCRGKQSGPYCFHGTKLQPGASNQLGATYEHHLLIISGWRFLDCVFEPVFDVENCNFLNRNRWNKLSYNHYTYTRYIQTDFLLISRVGKVTLKK